MEVRADADGSDEIAGLGRSFNTMADALKKYTDDLEGVIAERTSELEAANARLAALATTDPMTGLRNRRHFDEFARQAFEVATRNARPLSLVMVDTDHFKSINDRFGHPAGDEVLKDVARVMLATARKSDLCARIGGEEFVVLMPETGGQDAVAAAERIRIALAASAHPTVPELGAEPVTASFGVATRDGATGSVEDLVAAADAALYAAKSGGRNRVALAPTGAPAQASPEASA
jgi:diguanylate cyclase (GGDEF)-like protein